MPITDVNNTDQNDNTKIVIYGRNGQHGADVVQEDGFNKLLVKSSIVPEGLGDLFIQRALNNGSPDMNVNGTNINPIIFSVSAESGVNAKDIVVRELRFSGFDNGIKITTFMAQNSDLTNGILVRITSEGITNDFLPIKDTSDFDSSFAFGDGGKFSLVISSGGDYLSATFSPRDPFILVKDTSDKVEVLIRDNLNNIDQLRFVVFGFRV